MAHLVNTSVACAALVPRSRRSAGVVNICAKNSSQSCQSEKHLEAKNGEIETVRTRRQAIRGAILCSATLLLAQWPGEVLADERVKKEGAVEQEQSVIGGIMSLFDSEETTKSGRKLPKAYLKSARGVVTSLRESFTGVSKNEGEFRRSADSAKAAIRDYVANWRGSNVIATEDSYQALEKALRMLGEFYSKKGPRAVLPDDVRSRVLEALQLADDAL